MQRRTSRPWDVREKVVAVSNDNFNGSFVHMECKFVQGARPDIVVHVGKGLDGVWEYKYAEGIHVWRAESASLYL